jgi:nucleotide-binding universal stress UspA family protein
MLELPQRILVPFDFSTRSTRAVEYAARLAARFGASIQLLHVYASPDSLASIVPGASGGLDEERSARELAIDELHRLKQTITTAEPIRVDTAVVAGSFVAHDMNLASRAWE